MPAVSTRLEILSADADSVVIDRRDLWWWKPGSLFGDLRFVKVFDNGYLDRIADLSRDDFKTLNAEQIVGALDYVREQSQDKIADLDALISHPEFKAYTFRVTLYEWESGLDF